MIKSYNQRFYPNPFRYRKLNAMKNLDDILEKVRQNIQPFLNENFLSIENYIDEFNNLQSERRLIRILRNKIKSSSTIIRNKSKFLSESLISNVTEKNNLTNYQRNLRFLELPIHPNTDKKGFEIQFLSNDIIEDAIEEIDEGFRFIYDYCSKTFPETVDLWNDYALLNPTQFPFIAHDNLLEITYEMFDKIFDDLQKNSINLFNWVISGDIDSRIIKIIKPNLKRANLISFWVILESLLNIALLLLIVQYAIKNVQLLALNKNKKGLIPGVKKGIFHIKKVIGFKKFQIKQKIKKFRIKFTNFKSSSKYKFFTLITTKTKLN